MEVVCSYQFYLTVEKEACNLSFSSKIKPALISICPFSAHNLSFLILCNEAGEHLRGLFLLRRENSVLCWSSLTQARREVRVLVASPVHHAGTVTAGSYFKFLGVSHCPCCWLGWISETGYENPQNSLTCWILGKSFIASQSVPDTLANVSPLLLRRDYALR